MARYVDGFVLAVPKANLDAYKKMARSFGKLWMKLGALEYVECWADDVKSGKLTSFPQSVMLKDDEEVVFSYIVYKSRKDRDRINKLVMSDPMMEQMDPSTNPFDGKRMFFGGFKEIVSLGTTSKVTAAGSAVSDGA